MCPFGRAPHPAQADSFAALELPFTSSVGLVVGWTGVVDECHESNQATSRDTYALQEVPL